MKKVIGLVIILFVGWGSIRLMTVLSADAMAMAIGVLMGVLAGVPTTLLALWSRQARPAAREWSLSVVEGHVERRYTVIAGNGSPYVLDNATGERFAIACTERSRSVQPKYEVMQYEQ